MAHDETQFTYEELMATYDTTTHPLAFAHMEGGVKTVYVVPNTPEFSVVCAGDRLEFDNMGFITVGTVRRYESLVDLMQAEGFGNIIPEADDEAAAIEAVESASDWNRTIAAERGILALRVREARRKS